MPRPLSKRLSAVLLSGPTQGDKDEYSKMQGDADMSDAPEDPPTTETATTAAGTEVSAEEPITQAAPIVLQKEQSWKRTHTDKLQAILSGRREERGNNTAGDGDESSDDDETMVTMGTRSAVSSRSGRVRLNTSMDRSSRRTSTARLRSMSPLPRPATLRRRAHSTGAEDFDDNSDRIPMGDESLPGTTTKPGIVQRSQSADMPRTGSWGSTRPKASRPAPQPQAERSQNWFATNRLTQSKTRGQSNSSGGEKRPGLKNTEESTVSKPRAPLRRVKSNVSTSARIPIRRTNSTGSPFRELANLTSRSERKRTSSRGRDSGKARGQVEVGGAGQRLRSTSDITWRARGQSSEPRDLPPSKHMEDSQKQYWKRNSSVSPARSVASEDHSEKRKGSSHKRMSGNAKTGRRNRSSSKSPSRSPERSSIGTKGKRGSSTNRKSKRSSRSKSTKRTSEADPEKRRSPSQGRPQRTSSEDFHSCKLQKMKEMSIRRQMLQEKADTLQSSSHKTICDFHRQSLDILDQSASSHTRSIQSKKSTEGMNEDDSMRFGGSDRRWRSSRHGLDDSNRSRPSASLSPDGRKHVVVKARESCSLSPSRTTSTGSLRLRLQSVKLSALLPSAPECSKNADWAKRSSDRGRNTGNGYGCSSSLDRDCKSAGTDCTGKNLQHEAVDLLSMDASDLDQPGNCKLLASKAG